MAFVKEISINIILSPITDGQTNYKAEIRVTDIKESLIENKFIFVINSDAEEAYAEALSKGINEAFDLWKRKYLDHQINWFLDSVPVSVTVLQNLA